MSKDKVFVNFFRGYRRMSDDDAKKLREVKNPPTNEFVDLQQTPDVICEMFAPDPATGNPSSDLYIRAHSDSDVRDYIDKYMQSMIVDSPHTNDVDLALDTVKSRFESNDEYFNRLQQLVSNDAN